MGCMHHFALVQRLMCTFLKLVNVQETTPDTEKEREASLSLPNALLAQQPPPRESYQMFADRSVRLLSTPEGLVLQLRAPSDGAPSHAEALDMRQKGLHAVQVKYLQSKVSSPCHPVQA
jgi:hypothetical protein